jgi:hypothetical protein
MIRIWTGEGFFEFVKETAGSIESSDFLNYLSEY